MHVLQQQVSCMEEQLSEARLECSRLKTELVSEKSAWEITKSEMTSSINKVGFKYLHFNNFIFYKIFNYLFKKFS